MEALAAAPSRRTTNAYEALDARARARALVQQPQRPAWLDQQAASILRGDWVDPADSKVTLSTSAAQWQSIQVTSDSTRRIADNALRLHILPVLGKHKLGVI